MMSSLYTPLMVPEDEETLMMPEGHEDQMNCNWDGEQQTGHNDAVQHYLHGSSGQASTARQSLEPVITAGASDTVPMYNERHVKNDKPQPSVVMIVSSSGSKDGSIVATASTSSSGSKDGSIVATANTSSRPAGSREHLPSIRRQHVATARSYHEKSLLRSGREENEQLQGKVLASVPDEGATANSSEPLPSIEQRANEFDDAPTFTMIGDVLSPAAPRPPVGGAFSGRLSALWPFGSFFFSSGSSGNCGKLPSGKPMMDY
jgi:hypothetical protein